MGMLAVAVVPAGASADTYFVVDGGTGTSCTVGDPCGTVEDALAAHRVAPQPDDVIDVGEGQFPGNVEADQPEDDGLTIRGTQSGAGTTLVGEDFGGITGAAVGLGLCDQAGVTLQDANVTVDPAADPATYALDLEGGSDLVNVGASNAPGSDADAVLEICDGGTRVRGSSIDATGTDATAGILGFEGFQVVASTIELDSASGPGIVHFPFFPTPPVVVKRSTIDSDPANNWPGVISSGRLVFDSSLLTGGAVGLAYDGTLFPTGGTWQVQNATIDVGMPGVYDSALADVALMTVNRAPAIDVNIDSSILAEEVQTELGSNGAGSITCTNSDIQLTLIDPPVTDDCDISPGNPQGNTTTDPAVQFVGGNPFDWALAAGAPAIDAGNPSGTPAGFSHTDRAGAKRVAPGTSATCPAGRLDMGAYERGGVPCVIEDPVIKDLSPEVGVPVGATSGVWTNDPTDYRWQWRRCQDVPPPTCEDIGPYRRTPGYTPVAADVGFRLRVRVRAENANGVSQPAAISAPTRAVADSG